VAEQKDRLGGTRALLAGKIDLQGVSEILAAMKADSSAEWFKLLDDKGGDAVYGGLVITGGFDLNQFANGFDDPAPVLFEVAQAFFAGYFLNGRFPTPVFGHNFLSRYKRCQACEGRAVQYNLQAVCNEL
jgi:hypothetical protein